MSMHQIIFEGPSGPLLVSASNPLPTTATGVGGSSSDREFVVSHYTAKNAFTGASVGDTITCTRVYDVSTSTPSLGASIWFNESTSAALSGAPSAANLTLEGVGGPVAAQLPTSLGQKSSAQSLPVVLSNDGPMATFATTQTITLGTAVTTVSNGAGQTIKAGRRTYQAILTGTSGTYSATVKIQGTLDGTNWVDIGTITLSGTATQTDAFSSDDRFPTVRYSVTAISGTGASLAIYAGA